jgi:hypothetical protein
VHRRLVRPCARYVRKCVAVLGVSGYTQRTSHLQLFPPELLEREDAYGRAVETGLPDIAEHRVVDAQGLLWVGGASGDPSIKDFQGTLVPPRSLAYVHLEHFVERYRPPHEVPAEPAEVLRARGRRGAVQ